MKREIPVRNVYYLLSYAWEFISHGTERFVGLDNFTNSTNLMARLMDIAVRTLLRRGISKEYITTTDEIRGIRGKFNLSQSVAAGKLRYGKTICSYDEFGFDHASNQIIKAAIRVLLSQSDLTNENGIALKGYVAQLEHVSERPLTKALFTKVKLHANNRHYKFALELCHLILESLVISSESREILLSNFLEDSVKMDRIFEKFVKNFYSVHLSDALVGSPKFNWEVETNDFLFAERIPELRTDVAIDRNGKRLIIDAKYYVEAMKQSHSGKFKFRRDHLSQLMEYMRTSLKKEGVETRGMLLYPTVNDPIDNAGKIEGFEIRVATIDLSLQWEAIEKAMMSFVMFFDANAERAA